MATHDAACSLRYNPLRNGYLGDKIGVFERKKAEFILCVLSALFLPKSSPPNGDGHSIFLRLQPFDAKRFCGSMEIQAGDARPESERASPACMEWGVYLPLCDGRLSQCLLQLVALGGTEAVEELRHLHAALACQLQFVQL